MTKKVMIDFSMLTGKYRSTDVKLKAAWYYMWAKCDQAGVYEIDRDLFEFENGFSIDFDKFCETFYEMVARLGERILFKNHYFVNYHGKTPNPTYNPHKPAVRCMMIQGVEFDELTGQTFFSNKSTNNQNQTNLGPTLDQPSLKVVSELSECEYELSTELNEKEKTRKKIQYTEEFEELWKRYDYGRNKQGAFEQWKTLSEKDKALALEKVDAWQRMEKAECEQNNRNHTHLLNFLKKARWEDKIKMPRIQNSKAVASQSDIHALAEQTQQRHAANQ
jgi:hypothetical protein